MDASCMAYEESKGNLFEFIAYIVACRKSHVSRVVPGHILE